MNIQQHIIKDRKLKQAAAKALQVGENRLTAGMTFDSLQQLYKHVGLSTDSQDQTPIKIINDCMYQLTVTINENQVTT